MSKGRKSRRVINKTTGRPMVSDREMKQRQAAKQTPPPFPDKPYTKAKAARYHRKKRQVEVLEPDLVRIDGDSWAIAKMRKATACRLCPRQLAAGDRAFRPLFNSGMKAERICLTCMNGIIAEAVKEPVE